MASKLNSSNRVYIAGPMTGYPGGNLPKFREVEKKLRALGCDVLNFPNVLDTIGIPYILSDKLLFNKLVELESMCVRKCTDIILLDGWNNSKGVRRELSIAIEEGLDVHLESELE